MADTTAVPTGRSNRIQVRPGDGTSSQGVLRGPVAGAPAKLLAGGVSLNYAGTAVDIFVQGSFAQGFSIRSEFKVSVSARVSDVNTPLKYGLVQNVMYEHMEAEYDRGRMLADTVGPFVDVGPAEAPPFIHGNEVSPQFSVGPLPGLAVDTTFTDRPSFPVQAQAPAKMQSVVCGRLRRIKVVTVFKVGLVGQVTKTGSLFLLGVVDHWYRLAFDFVVDWENNRITGAGPSGGVEHSIVQVTNSKTKAQQPHPLVPGDLVVGLPRAGDRINKRLRDETIAMEKRCKLGQILP